MKKSLPTSYHKFGCGAAGRERTACDRRLSCTDQLPLNLIVEDGDIKGTAGTIRLVLQSTTQIHRQRSGQWSKGKRDAVDDVGLISVKN